MNKQDKLMLGIAIVWCLIATLPMLFSDNKSNSNEGYPQYFYDTTR